jgi:hypothetical protein
MRDTIAQRLILPSVVLLFGATIFAVALSFRALRVALRQSRFRFSCHDHSGAEVSRCQQKSSEFANCPHFSCLKT